jgi:peptide deformylase
MKIVTDTDKLRKPTEKVSLEEGNKIAETLWKTLESHKGGIGLSANQIGINKSVCIINVKDKLVLINPRIVNLSEEKTPYYEGCLSIPNKMIKTLRHKTITIEADNLANQLTFGPDDSNLTKENYWYDKGLLESVCVQHEIDHLNGKLMIDKEIRLKENKEKVIKFGRNEKVLIQKNNETQYVKYKKAELLLKDGWKII